MRKQSNCVKIQIVRIRVFNYTKKILWKKTKNNKIKTRVARSNGFGTYQILNSEYSFFKFMKKLVQRNLERITRHLSPKVFLHNFQTFSPKIWWLTRFTRLRHSFEVVDSPFRLSFLLLRWLATGQSTNRAIPQPQ